MNRIFVYIATVAPLLPLGNAALAQTTQYDTSQQPSTQYYSVPSDQQQILNEQRQEERAQQQYEAEREAQAEAGERQAEHMREAEARANYDWYHRQPNQNWQTYGLPQHRSSAAGVQTAPVQRQHLTIAQQLRRRYNPQDNDYGLLLEDMEDGVFTATIENAVMWIAWIFMGLTLVMAYLWYYERSAQHEMERAMAEIVAFFAGQNIFLFDRSNESVARCNKQYVEIDAMEVELAELRRERAAMVKADRFQDQDPLENRDVRGAAGPDPTTSSPTSVTTDFVEGEAASEKPRKDDKLVRALTQRLESTRQELRFAKEQLRKVGMDSGGAE